MKKKNCYRCGLQAAGPQYMGHDYCAVCLLVVSQMSWLIQHGAPVGFPMSPPGDPDYFLKQLENR